MLLDEVKEKLRIIGDDQDHMLLDLIGRSEAAINEIMGVELNYEEPGEAQELLLERVRYDYNNALEYFEENFAAKILRVQLQVAAKELSADGES
jgi:hypothetical protein